jgi:NADH dehydrogenase [ubiquinone] 1 alpha subcomplex assembly factor 1
MEEAVRRLFDFNSPEELGCWEVWTEGVMGGASTSRIAVSAESIATFQGTVSLEHEGGFASVRTYPQRFGLAGYDGLRILVRGDGKRYRLRLGTNDEEDGVAYEYPFETKARTWMSIDVPLARCAPTFRGSAATDAPKLIAESIRRIGVLLADGQEGPFRIDIDWIDAYGEQE